MAETAVKEKANGIPVPEEGTEEFARMNKMAKIAIPIVLIIFTMGVLQQQAFGMIYVNIGDQLGQANLAPLITSIPGIVLGIVCVIYGSLGDFVSLKKMMILGTIVFVLGSILGCFGDLSIWIVIAARTVQSAGWQVSGSIFLVLVSKYIEKKKRVIWYGVFVAVFRIAAALGVFLAGYMTLVDWRILFGIGIIAVFFIPILAKNLPDEHAKGARVDVIGFTLIGLFAGSVTMFFTDMTIFWGIAVLVTGVAFVVYINKAADPFITPEMLTNPARNLCRMIRTEITAPPATRLLEEGDRLEAAGVELTVLHTPGHTPGSVCFRAGNHLFTGDTLFHGGYGRTDFPGGSPEDMRRSLARLAPLETACAIYPGH